MSDFFQVSSLKYLHANTYKYTVYLIAELLSYNEDILPIWECPRSCNTAFPLTELVNCHRQQTSFLGKSLSVNVIRVID